VHFYDRGRGGRVPLRADQEWHGRQLPTVTKPRRTEVRIACDAKLPSSTSFYERRVGAWGALPSYQDVPRRTKTGGLTCHLQSRLSYRLIWRAGRGWSYRPRWERTLALSFARSRRGSPSQEGCYPHERPLLIFYSATEVDRGKMASLRRDTPPAPSGWLVWLQHLIPVCSSARWPAPALLSFGKFPDIEVKTF
jgi:hypothetical protein